MESKRVLFLSKSFSDSHPMLLRWKSYYKSRRVKFFSHHVHWEMHSVDNNKKLKLLLKWLHFIIRNQIDFVHANDLESGLFASHLKKKFRLRYLYDAHEIFSNEVPVSEEGEFVRKLKLHAENKVIKNAKAVVVPNIQRIKFLSKIHPAINGEKYVLIENKSLTHGGKKVEASFVSGLPKKKKVFYGGSFWYARKQENFPLLSEALNKEKMNLVLSGGDNEYLQKLLAESGHIHYVGNIPPDQFDDFISHVDICLAWYYPTTINDELCAPLKIFDYLKAQKLIVAPSLPYIKELAARYPGQIHLFEPGDWQDCLKKILLIRDAETLNTDITSCTWESQYNDIDEAFRKIIFAKKTFTGQLQ